MAIFDTRNTWNVRPKGDEIHFTSVCRNETVTIEVTHREAALLAAWLVAVADDSPDYEDFFALLRAVDRPNHPKGNE